MLCSSDRGSAIGFGRGSTDRGDTEGGDSRACGGGTERRDRRPHGGSVRSIKEEAIAPNEEAPKEEAPKEEAAAPKEAPVEAPEEEAAAPS